jgi:AAA15 family ATPase/GTPase
MIAEFKIKNFFSIRSEQIISFEPTSDTYKSDEYCIEVKENVKLLKFGAIYGANASGKTNILNALSFFKDLMINIPKDKTEPIDFDPFLLDGDSRKENSEMAMTFYQNGERYQLVVQFNQTKIILEKLICYPSKQPATLYIRTYNEQTDSTHIEFGNKLELNKKSQTAISGNTINNTTVLAAFGKSNVETSRLNIIYEFFSKHVNDVLSPNELLSSYTKHFLEIDKDNSLKDFLVTFLKASDFNICDVELQEKEIIIDSKLEQLIKSAPIPEDAKSKMIQKGKITNSEIHFKHETDNGMYDLGEESESRGTIRFMGMAVILKQLLKENRFICIDEIENSLHYELLSYFIKVFLANSTDSSQLLVTTHDLNLLNEDFIRRDTIWFTDKNNSGETEITRLSSLGLHKNLSPYNAYKQGKLVKLPFLGSIYLKDDSSC